ncbi:MAG TPA: hypothetical protein VF665_23245 [Longimicrobium sp.]|uniref:hypothetical protein n=1 Tax=Longimicrobium sp. TaxID=2029185 RepID=UPI002EDB6505
MTIILDLPQELERALAAEAAQLGLPLDEYALRVLAGNRLPAPMERPRNGRELVAYWEQAGIIGSRPDIDDAPRYARQVREAAERVRRERP